MKDCKGVLPPELCQAVKPSGRAETPQDLGQIKLDWVKSREQPCPVRDGQADLMGLFPHASAQSHVTPFPTELEKYKQP